MSTQLTPILTRFWDDPRSWTMETFVEEVGGDGFMISPIYCPGAIEEFVDHAVAEKKPFFLWYGVFLPHTPHNPPERLLKPYRDMGLPLPIAKYYAMCDWFDETCGQLINCLEKKKVRDDTLIVYVTDNGWIQNPARNGYAVIAFDAANNLALLRPSKRMVVIPGELDGRIGCFRA